MEKDLTQERNKKMLRYGMLIPLVLMITSVVSCCLSYSDARQDITNDLNEAMIALASANSELWTRQDTITALRKMHETTNKPLIYQACDLNFRNATLRDEAYFTLALVDKTNPAPKIQGNKIASDSIMIVAENAADGLAIQVQGFADCSMASVFSASNQTLPGVLFVLSILSMAGISAIERRKATPAAAISIDNIKLTPMQRQLTQILLDAPSRKVSKNILCATLWGNKSNADESLYTLVKRTKTALADSGIKIICNRGESYEIRINS